MGGGEFWGWVSKPGAKVRVTKKSFVNGLACQISGALVFAKCFGARALGVGSYLGKHSCIGNRGRPLSEIQPCFGDLYFT
jgi:hypothetical protein